MGSGGCPSYITIDNSINWFPYGVFRIGVTTKKIRFERVTPTNCSHSLQEVVMILFENWLKLKAYCFLRWQRFAFTLEHENVVIRLEFTRWRSYRVTVGRSPDTKQTRFEGYTGLRWWTQNILLFIYLGVISRFPLQFCSSYDDLDVMGRYLENGATSLNEQNQLWLRSTGIESLIRLSLEHAQESRYRIVVQWRWHGLLNLSDPDLLLHSWS